MTLYLKNKKISDNKYTKHKSHEKNDESLKCQNVKIKSNNKDTDKSEKINSNNDDIIKSNKIPSNRCNYVQCNKKLRISDMKCKCEFTFCSLHRLPESHECIFDYKSKDSDKIIENMKCVSSKIDKI